MWRLVLCGAGFGIFASPNNRLMMNAVPRERSGSAGGIIATARTLGQTVGAALVALMFGLFDFSSGGAADAARAAIWLARGLRRRGAGDRQPQAPALSCVDILDAKQRANIAKHGIGRGIFRLPRCMADAGRSFGRDVAANPG